MNEKEAIKIQFRPVSWMQDQKGFVASRVLRAPQGEEIVPLVPWVEAVDPAGNLKRLVVKCTRSWRKGKDQEGIERNLPVDPTFKGSADQTGGMMQYMARKRKAGWLFVAEATPEEVEKAIRERRAKAAEEAAPWQKATSTLDQRIVKGTREGLESALENVIVKMNADGKTKGK